jgi:hypothetical protein
MATTNKISSETNSDIINNFWSAPNQALFKQAALVQVLGYSPEWFERQRWQGTGIPYIKLSHRCVVYRKADVLAWLEQYQPVKSSSQWEVQHES